MQELKRCSHVIISYNDKRIVAFITFTIELEDEYDPYSSMCIYVYELHVDCNFRGFGMGQFLILKTFKENPEYPRMLLTCYTKNFEALRFYFKTGFKIHSTCPRKCHKKDYVILYKDV